MSQFHPRQHGIFLVTTNAQDRSPWCVDSGIPEILIESLWIAKEIYKAKLFGFCVLPDHMHIIVDPGKRGLSRFMQSFKSNSARSIRRYRLERRQHVSGEHVLAADISRVDADLSSNIFHGWQHGFDSRGIGTDTGMARAVRYVESNAARHRLVRSAHDWPWTSLHYPELRACPE